MLRRLALATALVAIAPAAPALAYTVGYVDTLKVLTSYSGAKSAQSQVQKEVIAYQKAFADRQQKIMAAQKAGKSASEIQKLTEQYERELAPLKEKAARLDTKLSGEVKVKIEGIIQRVAKAKKVDVVLDKAAILYGGTDLTADVVRALR